MVGITGVDSEIIEVGVDMIKPNPDQARLDCDANEINVLAADISRRGLLHPIIVSNDGEFFTIVCGRRRLLAAKKAGCATVRALVLSNANEALETALAENMLRKDLATLDQAEAFSLLMQEKKLCLKDVATLVGKSVPSVCETVKLMRIPQELRYSDKLRRKPLRFQIQLSKYGSEKEIRDAFSVFEITGQLPPLRQKSGDSELMKLSKKITNVKADLSDIDFLNLDMHNKVHANLYGEIVELLAALHGRGWFRMDIILDRRGYS